MKLNKFTLSVISSISMVSASAYAVTSEEEATIIDALNNANPTTVDVVNSPEPKNTPSVNVINLDNRGRGRPVSPS